MLNYVYMLYPEEQNRELLMRLRVCRTVDPQMLWEDEWQEIQCLQSEGPALFSLVYKSNGEELKKSENDYFH